ncbi:MAG TPA: hypothetical protein PKE59_07030 [Novosphingobium sp.]|nr:hypothetical protein [Novosphingobium sp.]HPB20845.1 hypothetical protein [Novosphingobium sp.]HQQ08285.1 hypothetical protein [Novosphingobium sp.]
MAAASAAAIVSFFIFPHPRRNGRPVRPGYCLQRSSSNAPMPQVQTLIPRNLSLFFAIFLTDPGNLIPINVALQWRAERAKGRIQA